MVPLRTEVAVLMPLLIMFLIPRRCSCVDSAQTPKAKLQLYLGSRGDAEFDDDIQSIPEITPQFLSVLGTTPETRTLLCTPVSGRHIRLALRWHDSLRRLGYSNQTVFFAEDEVAHAALSRAFPEHTVRVLSHQVPAGYPWSVRPVVHQAPDRLASYLLALVHLNLTVVLTDVHSRWLKDPFPFFSSPSPAFDVILSQESHAAPPPANSSTPRHPVSWQGQRAASTGRGENGLYAVYASEGLVLVRPTPGGVHFLREWRRGILEASCWRTHVVDSQAELNAALSRLSSDYSQGVRVGLLPVQDFPPPCLLSAIPGEGGDGELTEGQSEPCAKQSAIFRHSMAKGLITPVVVRSTWQSQGRGKAPTVTTKQEGQESTPLAPKEGKRGSKKSKKGKKSKAGGASEPLGVTKKGESGLAVLRRVAKQMVTRNGESFLILVVLDGGFGDMLENWLLSVAKFKHDHQVMFIAEDSKANALLSKRWPKQTVYMHSRVESDSKSNSSYIGFGSNHFNEIVDRRPGYILELLEMGITVMCSDADMVWLRDPIPYFKKFPSYDAILQEDGTTFGNFHGRFPNDALGKPWPKKHFFHYMICTCLLYFRPTEATKRLVVRWRKSLQEAAKQAGHPVNDQPVFSAVVARTTKKQAKLGLLPIHFFPSGCVYFGHDKYCKKSHRNFLQALERREAMPYVVHNNFIRGKEAKVERFKQAGLWLLDSASKQRS